MKERGKAIDKLRRMNGLLRQILLGSCLFLIHDGGLWNVTTVDSLLTS